VVGDAIVDEYVYVRPLGRSPKENIISNMILRKESFRGGVFAAAEHLKGFCKSVEIHRGPGTTVKRRFVESTYLRKLFEVHEEGLEKSYNPLPRMDDYDMVIAADFGHGAISTETIGAMQNKAKFLAVNAQTNSANHGFNLITKYQRANYVVLDELEARLAAHDRDSQIEKVIEKLEFSRIVVTLGPNGAIGYESGKFYKAKGCEGKVLDTMGAGDAFFCVTAPFAAVGADMPTILEVGNAAGAIKCRNVGQAPVTREELLKIVVDKDNGLL